MSEFDDLISGAVGDFRDAEAGIPAITPGADAVRATVKHRRTVRLTTLSVVGALLIAAPIAAFAADPHGNNPPPTPGESVTTVPVGPSPSEAAPTSTAPAPPDGTLTAAQIGAVKVTIPAFRGDWCPTKQIKLPASMPTSQAKAWVAKVVHTDLDGDPALETAALILCQRGETPSSEVVAFDRDAAGNVVVLGTIVADSQYFIVRDIKARDGGGIVAGVTDFIACCGSNPDDERHQQREYGWDGTKFRQLGGPASYGDPARITDLQVTVTEVVLGPVVDGKRTGTAKVTVKNNGPNPSGRFLVSLANCSFNCFGPDVPAVKQTAFGTYESPHAPLAAGQQLSETLTVTVDASFTTGTVRVTVQATGLKDKHEIEDTNPDNNETTLKIRTS